MICKIEKLAWVSPLVLGLACSAGTSDGSPNNDLDEVQSGRVAARSSELKASELAPAVASAALPYVGSTKAIAKNPAGQIMMGGTSSFGGVPAMGGMTGMGGATSAGGSTGAGGGTSSSCCDQCDTQCSPNNWICIEDECKCKCRGSGDLTTQSL